MKKLLTTFSAALLLAGCGESLPRTWNEGINVTPTPAEMNVGEGRFALSAKTVFVAQTAEAQTVAEFFAAKIGVPTGLKLAVVGERPASNFIDLAIAPELDLNDEGYTLEVTANGVEAKAKTPQGLFYAMQTVLQLLPAEIESASKTSADWSMPAVSIKDQPRFDYRGLHLDVCRHFLEVDFLKKQLDLMAMFKINTFHWHLTEDQGWRIEIKKYPRLTEVGATREEGEGNQYGPFFYTQEQVKEVVAYAKERFIEVIPEIEMPGHGVAAIAAYPELSCRGEAIPVRNIWGVANDVYCAGNEQVFTFLEDVLTEVMPLFESEYFHIGGDECPKGRWEECPKCQAKIKELGLKDDAHNSAEMKLQSYFVQRMGKFLEANGKKMIGWDEILEGGLAPSAIVMSWRGEQGGIESANMGHDVIMTPGDWMYLDKYQGDPKLQPVTIGGMMNLAKVYSYEPIPAAIEPDKRHHILGAQSNVWSEYKYTPEDYENDIWPRFIATAELTWSPAERKNYEDFERRIVNQRVRLDGHGVQYYIPQPEDKAAPSCNSVAFTDSVTMDFKTTEPVARIVYTTDGSEPTLRSKEFAGPMSFTASTTLKVASVLPQGRMSAVRTIALEKQTLAPAVEPTMEGIRAEYYKGMRRTVAELEGLTPDETETIAAPHFSKYRVGGHREVYPADFCSTIQTGFIKIPADGVYTFSTNDELWIDGVQIIDNAKDNPGTARIFSRSDRSLALAAGAHSFKLVGMGATFGGFPRQWERMTIEIRPAGQPKFERMDEKYFF